MLVDPDASKRLLRPSPLVLVDTNVVLDLLPKRSPWFEDAAWLFTRIELHEIVGLIGATS